MASDGPGKYRERKTRSSKPYERPRGIIRRVTDSVTGLFSSSWLSGWLGNEDEEEATDPQTSRAQTATTLPPPGESFIFAQPVTARRSFRPIYPEEGETENSNQESLGVNEGASTSGIRMGAATSSTTMAAPAAIRALGSETPSPSLPVRKLPILSSTPAPMFAARTKGHLEPRPLHLIPTSTPTGDDGSEVSESSVDTGVDASVIPRPDERDYQQEILQLDEESLQTLRETLTKTAPGPPLSQTLPSLDETRKRPRDAEIDTSIRAEGSLSSRSLFSETGEVAIGTPQPSGLANKRPRFNISSYGCPVANDRSVLSNSTFKSSPFYPGKTMYGGASLYRKNRLQTRTPNQATRVQVKAKAPSSEDGGLSQAARRILDSLEQMSTPISDAKRIPTPTLGQRGSFLDAAPSYTASFYKHRPVLRPAPPISKLLTPTKVPVRENLSKSFISSPSTSAADKSRTRSVEPKQKEAESSKEEEKKILEKSKKPSDSPLAKLVEDSNSRLKSISTPVTSSPAVSSPGPFKFNVSSTITTTEKTQETVKKTTTTLSEVAQSEKRGGGKIKSKVVDSGRVSSKQDEEEVAEEPKLPAVSLNITSMPKINLPLSVPSPTPVISTGPPLINTNSTAGFKFSIPEVVHHLATPNEMVSNDLTFTFRSPASVTEDGSVTGSSVSPLSKMPSTVMFNSSSPTFSPKLKANAKKEVEKTPKLQKGSILDILKPKGSSPGNASPLVEKKVEEKLNAFDSPKTSSEFSKSVIGQTVNNVDKTNVSQGFEGFEKFKQSSNEWECSVCMLRNKDTVDKCVACESDKPGKSKTAPSSVVSSTAASLTGNGTGWGTMFKKSTSEWDCDVCMVRNKDIVDKCVACETARPGSKATPAVENKPVEITGEKSNFVGFGLQFAKTKGEWECDTCLVRNKSDTTKCISCETPKPGAANVTEAITGNFKFGVNTNDSSASSSNFKFGLDSSQTEVKSTSGFNFGVSAKSAEDSNSRMSTGFKFGIPEEENSVTKEASNESDKSSDKVPSASSGFSFGIKSSESKDKETTTPSFSFSAPKPAATSTEVAVAEVDSSKPAFTFGSQTSSTAFTFGVTPKAKEATGESQVKSPASEVKTATEMKSGSVLDVLKDNTAKSNEIFTFGSKVDKADGAISKPAFAFNNAVAATTSVESNATAPSGTIAFGANLKESGNTPSAAASLFTFGDKPSSTSSTPSFAFNATPAVMKDEPKAASTFTFGGKRENCDSGEPPKKMAFGGSGGGINNGVSATPNLFSFAGKDSKLNSGTGFSSPAATPAFGAPTPASNSTGAFQFGSTNLPAPAATSPPAFGNPAPAFGSPAPAFGSNNNNSTPSFTFGQPPEKKASTGFDFGQTATSAPSQGFNFTNAAAPPALFQFGQAASNNAPSSGGLFQFGAANTAVTPAAPFGGGDNPFNSPAPAPPSGRVMKKAVRRTRK